MPDEQQFQQHDLGEELRRQGSMGLSSLEKRTQRRVKVDIPMKIRIPHQRKTLPAIAENLSWGGARVLLLDPEDIQAHHICLLFPWTCSKYFNVQADILRTETTPDGLVHIGTRFSCLSPRNQECLEQVIQNVGSSHGADTLPLSGKLTVLCDTAEELRNLLGQIHNRELQLTTFSTHAIGQSVSLVLGCTQDLPPLRLRARIVRSEHFPEPLPDQHWVQPSHLLLRFEHSRRDLKEILQKYLHQSDEPKRRFYKMNAFPGYSSH